MKNGLEKSGPTVVAMKPVNKVGLSMAERAEPRVGTKGNMDQSHTCRTQCRESVSQRLARVRNAAKQHKKEKFTALLHHVDTDLLHEAFWMLKRQAAPGVDGVTWQDYEAKLNENLEQLHRNVHNGRYRAKPVRRRFIPKPDGRQRPLGVTALEDKIVQRAVVMVLHEIYEVDFLGFSYGFRPARGQHDALDSLAMGIQVASVNWILDADIRSFFDQLDKQWLMRFMEQRVGDRRILRLVEKWLKAGVLDQGQWSVSEKGTPQGAVASPLLANIYLHYVFDLWAERWRRREAKGKVILVRYADELVAGFEFESDARRFWDEMRKRFECFGLELHGEKTRLLEFGRYAAERRQKRNQGKPETFQFLGFIFICGQTRRGSFQLQRRTRADRMRAKLREIKEVLRAHMHASIPDQGRWLQRVLTGYFAYHAVPTDMRSLAAFHHSVVRIWRRVLSKRSQKAQINWERMERIANAWLPKPRILHPWPEQRFAVKHPRWEPNA